MAQTIKILVNALRPGDLIFSRSSILSSRIIRAVSFGPWSHVALVVDQGLLFEAAGADNDIGFTRIKLNNLFIKGNRFVYVGEIEGVSAISVLRLPSACRNATLIDKQEDYCEDRAGSWNNTSHYWTVVGQAIEAYVHEKYPGLKTWISSYWNSVRHIPQSVLKHKSSNHNEPLHSGPHDKNKSLDKSVFCSQLLWRVLNDLGYEADLKRHVLRDFISPTRLHRILLRTDRWKNITEKIILTRDDDLVLCEPSRKTGFYHNTKDCIEDMYRTIFYLLQPVSKNQFKMMHLFQETMAVTGEFQQNLQELLDQLNQLNQLNQSMQPGMPLDRKSNSSFSGSSMVPRYQADNKAELGISRTMSQLLPDIAMEWAELERKSACREDGRCIRLKRPERCPCSNPDHCKNL